MMFRLEDIIAATGAMVIENKTGRKEFNFSTDTRTIKEGEIYLPLKGANFDGENFLTQACDNGAEGCFITGFAYPDDKAKIVLKVKDTLIAYMQLANYKRKKLNPITIGITGSSGKTTTKEIVYSVLSTKFRTHKTFSNHNNEIGFCQTVMSMPDDTEILIVEMGMRGLGEIEILSKYSEPDYAVITNAGSAHIGRLGSLDNIAKAKSEIVKFLSPKGALVAQNNDRIKRYVSEYTGKKIYHDLNDVKITERKQSYTKFIYKNQKFELNVEGDYNVDNSVTAIELGYLLGMSYDEIKQGLLNYKPIEKRWEAQDIHGIKVINDSYNANPESMKASVSTFLQLYKNPVVVLGDMGELGDYTDELHKGVGEYLSALPEVKTAKFLTVGEYAKEIGEILEKSGGFVKNFENNDDVSKYIVDNIDAGTTIFLKASRSMKFEEIIGKLEGEVKL
ncbi:MAG: UDP-N-acetylmuramoyl-tripeptide--D-alanyl-D-alanine ligase [Candidatus Gastranaerophilaceae bacterium]|nr:UDP-N-acetylmuramoyl-tripeptide--D-alanyl-D-alanine ligase [Candidatus Gastranaerophilaceae bacterium]